MISIPSVSQKYAELVAWFQPYQRVAVALSGGIDSALLAKAAYDALGSKSQALIGISPSLANIEKKMAHEVSSWIGIDLKEIHTYEMDQIDYRKNDANRCYFCKSELFKQCLIWIKNNHYEILVEGTHVGDLGSDRPGMKAAHEKGVYSPYLELKINKDDIRAMAYWLQMPNWNKPQKACLSSRFPKGISIDEISLKKIELCEEILINYGFKEFRVRFHHDLVRLEISQDEWKAMNHPEKIFKMNIALKNMGFSYITLDLQPFRDEPILKKLSKNKIEEGVVVNDR